MTTALDLAPAVLLVGYLLVTFDYGLTFFSRTEPRVRPSVGLISVWSLHLVYLVLLGQEHDQFPATTVSQALTLVGFTLAAVYLLLEWYNGDRSTGFWTMIQVSGFQALAIVLRGPVPPRSTLFGEPLFGAHVFLALLGYAAFAVAASYGFLFLSLYSELKGRRFALFYGRLPPLEVLERMMTAALVVGFVALTGSVLTGGFWMHREEHQLVWNKDPMILLTGFTWALYGCALVLRRARQWRGRQTAIASLAGLGIIVGSLLVVRLMLPGFHLVPG
ncbi:MAG: cytochrome c biogenesis protein CcsA [Thermoanaerobaculia bacterium]|nr:cytochrome c biogenesis protein CcsA [Thermoanaerobaculia bacterium]